MQDLTLQIPIGKDVVTIELVSFGNKALLKNKDDYENLKKFGVKFSVKHGKMADNDYESYLKDRASHPSEDFAIDTNPYNNAINNLTASIFGGSKLLSNNNVGPDPNFKPPVNNQPNGGVQVKTIMDDKGQYKLYVGQIDAMGRKQGEGTEFYPNNRPKYTGKYVNDMANDSEGTYFYENAKIMYTGGIVDGILNGTGKLYHENGELGYEGQFANHSPSGPQCRIFDRHGNPIYQGGYADGVFFII